MRKLGVVLALIAVIVVVGATTSASAISSPQVFNLLYVPSQFGPLNGIVSDREPRGGDQFATAGTLYKWAGTKQGARVGRSQGIATVQSLGANGATVLFFSQTYLPGGTILSQGYGVIGAAAKATFSVIGGTGIYAGVRGYVKLRDIGNQNVSPVKANLEIHLLP